MRVAKAAQLIILNVRLAVSIMPTNCDNVVMCYIVCVVGVAKQGPRYCAMLLYLVLPASSSAVGLVAFAGLSRRARASTREKSCECSSARAVTTRLSVTHAWKSSTHTPSHCMQCKPLAWILVAQCYAVSRRGERACL